MAYTEIKERNSKKYYYRLVSVRKGKKVSKKRKYLGVNLSKKELLIKEKEADKQFEIMHKGKRKEFIEKIKSKIIKILKKNHIKRAGIFGSYAKGKQKKNSDVDILIEFDGSLLKLVRIERELENKIKIRVDLLTYRGIHPLLKNRILKEEIRII